MTRGLRGVLFDKDGTLVDAFGGWVAINHLLFLELRRRYGGRGREEDLRAALGMTEAAALPGGLLASGTEEQIYRAHHQLLGDQAPDWELFHPEIRDLSHDLFRRSPPPVTPRGRVKETLAALRLRGFRLGLATSDSDLNARRDLGPLGGELLEVWVTADRVAHPKPHPESVRLFCREVNLDPPQVAFVGDSPVDLATAREAGVGLFVAIRSPTCPEAVLAAADAVLDTVEGLPDLLGAPS